MKRESPSGSPSPAPAPSDPRDHYFAPEKAPVTEFFQTPGYFRAVFVTIMGLIAAVVLGWLVGTGEHSQVFLIFGVVAFCLAIVFVREFWWVPLVFLSASGFRTDAVGFRLTGFEVGFTIVAVAVLISMAMRTIRVAKPEFTISRFAGALFTYLALHALFVIFYNRYNNPVGLKNIVRGYYSIISPLLFSLLLARYCHARTVKPVLLGLLILGGVLITLAIPSYLLGWDPFDFYMVPTGIDWLTPGLSGQALRGSATFFLMALALWPSITGFQGKAFLSILIGLSALGTLISSGRIAVATCFVGTLILAAIRGKWSLLAVASAGVLGLSAVVTLNPSALYALPDSVHRALTIVNFSDVETSISRDAEQSDKWHTELREESYKYWTEDWATFTFGHGFGSWDESLDAANFTRDFEYAKKMAIRMGKTENSFSSTTNVFGLVGLLLYAAFAADLWLRLWRTRRRTPQASFERAMCEFSLTYLALFLVFAPFAGGPPNWEIFYWILGLLASRAYLGKSVEPARIQPPVRVDRPFATVPTRLSAVRPSRSS